MMANCKEGGREVVTEYGEIGRLVQLPSPGTLVVLWAVHEVRHKLVNAVGEIINADGPFYRTSRGWIRGKKDGSDYFAPRPRERSLRPCILRAVKYAQENWPDLPAQTH